MAPKPITDPGLTGAMDVSQAKMPCALKTVVQTDFVKPRVLLIK